MARSRRRAIWKNRSFIPRKLLAFLHELTMKKVVLWLLFAGFVAMVWYDAARNVILLDSITVPKSFEDRGYSSQVIAARVVDRLGQIEATVQTTARKDSVQLQSEVQLPDVEVPETKISVKSIVQFVQKFLNRAPSHIVGEITINDHPRAGLASNAAHLDVSIRVLRGPGIRSFQQTQTANTDPDEAVDLMARTILRDINPYVLALFYYDEEHNVGKALELINLCVGHSTQSYRSYGYNFWGLILRDQHNFDGALEMFQKAIDCDRKFALAHYNKGTVLYETNKLDAATDELNLAQSLDPLYPPTYTEWGNVLVTGKQFDKAIAKYQESLRVFSQNPVPYNNWGVALQLQGKLDEAIEKFKAAARLDNKRKYAIVFSNWGDALRAQGKLEEAGEQYQKAISIDATLAIAYQHFADVLFDQHKGTEAETQRRLARQRLQNGMLESPLL